MALFLLILLVLLAATGALWAVLKLALGVALGLLLAVAVAAAVLGWRIRRALRPRTRWRQVPGSDVQVLDRNRLPHDE
jgi:membrane protein implicated in regulation of membrane protease activity